MISQTDATTTTLVSPATTTTPVANSITSSHHNQANSLNSNSIHNGKSSKSLHAAKKRKKFDETIVDGFAIVAFKTWEDLQDELNERSSINAANNATDANSNTQSISHSTSTNNNNCTADKKAKGNSKQKSSSTSSAITNSSASCINQLWAGSPGTDNSNSTSTTNNTTTTTSSVKEASNKKKESAKKSAANSQASSKDKRNKTSSSEKLNLKRALEVSEKRLSILQEKLKQEQSKNRHPNHNNNSNNNIDTNQKHDTASIVVTNHHYSGPQAPTHITNKVEEIHSSTLRPNGILGQDLIKDPNQQASMPTKPNPYSPFHISPHLNHRPPPSSVIHHQSIQLHPPQSLTRMHQSQTQSQQHQLPKHSSHLSQSQHSTPPPSQTPLSSTLSHLHHQQHHHHQQSQQSSVSPPPPHPMHPMHQTPPHTQYQRQPPLSTHPQPSSIPPPPSPLMHQHLLQQHQTHHHHHQLPPPPSMHQFPPHPQASTMMSSMSLSSLPQPYSCPPSIYITDTISRQTSIIPPLGPALEQLAPQAQASRFGHSSVSHSITPYNPAVAPHHPMYYPTLPTERSFIEFARSYTGPGHLGYPNLMNSFPTPAPNITTNPYSFTDRWPRVALDHQRAVSRYNSLYQSTTALPDRTTYAASYASARPPSFPAGLFVSNQNGFCEAKREVIVKQTTD